MPLPAPGLCLSPLQGATCEQETGTCFNQCSGAQWQPACCLCYTPALPWTLTRSYFCLSQLADGARVPRRTVLQAAAGAWTSTATASRRGLASAAPVATSTQRTTRCRAQWPRTLKSICAHGECWPAQAGAAQLQGITQTCVRRYPLFGSRYDLPTHVSYERTPQLHYRDHDPI